MKNKQEMEFLFDQSEARELIGVDFSLSKYLVLYLKYDTIDGKAFIINVFKFEVSMLGMIDVVLILDFFLYI